MAYKNALIGELKYESGLTKKMLERIPIEKALWKPHEKSYTLGRLATHIAEIPQWISRVITIDDFDFLVQGFSRHTAESQAELMNIFHDKFDKAIIDLETMADEDFDKKWILRRGDQIIRELPKRVAIREWGFSHFIHHRGQLSVYLRLLEIPVPGMYGPSADER
ncbi:MAG TPA: DinB family protein [Chitinophagaceae bacterium]|jgi:uncharacterized damage-inducible protein DinB|nr:DinB family protein [Chitinophagaceae bacterium]